jgi:outer membrane lipoprotein-sorting protein
MPFKLKNAHFATIRQALVCLCIAGLSLSVQAFGVDELMPLLALNKGGKTTFIEKKFIANLDQTVESSGELVFVPPYRLERHTLLPKQESIVLDKDVLMWSRGKTQRTLALSDYPELSVLVTSLRASLSGDQPTLMTHYKMTVEGSAQAWKLGLTPKLSRVALKVRHIQLQGSQQFAHTIDFALADGDYSTLLVSKPSVQK